MKTWNSRGAVGSFLKLAHQTNGGLSFVDGDNFGNSVSAIGDFDGDQTQDLAVGTASYDTDGIDRGAVHLLFLEGGL